MLKSFVAWVMMTATVLKAEPIPFIMPEQLDLETRDLIFDERGIESRVIKTVPVPILATFEDRIPQTGKKTALGIYRGLNFQGMSMSPALVKSGIGLNGDIISGIVPFSKTNCLALPITPLAGIGAAISATYPASVAESFDFNSFWFGCVLGTVDDIVSAPINCQVSVGGFDSKGKRVAFQQFTYTPPGLTLVANMVQARLDSPFQGLNHVLFVVSYDSVRQLGVTLLDNLDFVVNGNTTK